MHRAFILAATLATTAAHADLRDLCVDRPGLGTPACTIDAGHVIVEAGLVDATIDRQPDMRTDTIVLGDLLLRYGLDDTTEAQIGWTAYGHVRTRDLSSGLVSRASGTGDVRLSMRKGLAGPGGPVAVQGFVTLPTGGNAIGAGDWSAGVLLPLDFDLGNEFSIAFTPEADAAVDQDGSGRHLSYGSTVGIDIPVAKKFIATAELAAFRDLDPDAHTTSALASLSFAYQSGDDLQLDAGAVAGLKESPDLELYIGIARRF